MISPLPVLAEDEWCKGVYWAGRRTCSVGQVMAAGKPNVIQHEITLKAAAALLTGAARPCSQLPSLPVWVNDNVGYHGYVAMRTLANQLIIGRRG